MSKSDELFKSIMSSFPRPLDLELIYVDEQLIPGGCISGIHFSRFLSLEVGGKLLLIREWLDGMYPNEFTRKMVVGRAGYSVQGLINVEEGLKKTRRDTIESFAREYYFPLNIILGDNIDKEIKGVYIGKPVDKERYFLTYFEQHGENHFLDSMDYSELYKDIEGNNSIEVTVELVMRTYESENMELISDRSIIKSKLGTKDITDIWEHIEKYVQMLSERYQKIALLEEYVLELHQRIALETYKGEESRKITNEKLSVPIDDFLKNYKQ